MSLRLAALLVLALGLCALAAAALAPPAADADPKHAKRCWPHDRYGNNAIPKRFRKPGRYASCEDCEPWARDAKCSLWFGGQTPGNRNGSTSHKGWPGITGIHWQVIANDNRGERRRGTRFNDELLGRNGSDRLYGLGGDDVIWGNSNAKLNGSRQRDRLSGGPGGDWIYASHGHNVIRGGSGNDRITAFFGRGTVDCGPGRDRVRIRGGGRSRYRLRSCERVTHP